MRISDCSSDVYSSDLPYIRIATGGEAPVGGREIDTDLILPIAEITIELERQPVSKVLMAGRDDAVLCLSVQQRFGGIGGPHVRPLPRRDRRGVPIVESRPEAARLPASPREEIILLLEITIGSASCRESVCQFV